ncbi:hypothetical protein ACFYT4_18085 [Streptomyces sp. NPDC004609]|uniref:hypothetical protein n=1 Tax=Streptomyces sp. NPDC004609 TaxID=3364704 RepID=UPI0036864090
MAPYNWKNLLNGSNVMAATYAGTLSDNCERGAKQYICYGGSPAFDQPITVGDVLFLPYSKQQLTRNLKEEADTRRSIERVAGPTVAKKYGPDLLRHEVVHSKQWARYSNAGAYIAAYTAESVRSPSQSGVVAAANRFEEEANLWWGGYLRWGPARAD